MSMTEDEINKQHQREWDEARSVWGNKFSVPREVVAAISERTRQRWIEYVDRRDGKATDPANKHDKTDRLAKFIAENPGRNVTVQDLMDAADCSKGTAHKYIDDNRSSFVKVERGVYRIIDAAQARAEARSSSSSSGVRPMTSAEQDIVNQFLGGATGQTGRV
jgi:hypothetical protein